MAILHGECGATNSATHDIPAKPRGGIHVVRLRVAEVLMARGMSWYKLAQVSGLSQTQVYRIRHAHGRFHRLTEGMLDRLCTALDTQPGELLEWIPPPSRMPRPRAVRRQAR